MPRFRFYDKIERNLTRVVEASIKCGFKSGELKIWTNVTGELFVSDGNYQVKMQSAKAAWLVRHCDCQEHFWWNLTDMQYPPANFSGIW